MKSQMRSTLISAALAAALVLVAQQGLRFVPAIAAQNELVPPTTGVLTGVQFSQLIGDAFRSLASGNKGATAPANVSGAVADGLPWIDDSVTPWLKKRYIDGGWATEGAYDPATNSWVGIIGGGAPVSIASGATVDLGSVPQANVTITGTTGVTGFGSSAAAGVVKIVRFAGALILTHSASLKVPGGYPLTTAADDRAIVTHLGSGVWEVTQYTRANGVPIDMSLVGKPQYGIAVPVSGIEVYGGGQALTRASYPAYVAKATVAQNGTRTSANATIASVADTSGFGVGMPVEGTGINAGCTIASLVANTSITLNSGGCVTSSGTSTVTVFLTGYGTAGSSTTIGVQNCQGAMMAGRDDTVSAASRITTAGSGINGTALNTFGGAQTVTITQGNIPNYALDLSGLSILLNGSPDPRTTTLTTAQAGAGASNLLASIGGTVTALLQGTGGVTSGGSGTALNKMPPVLIANCVVRVVP